MINASTRGSPSWVSRARSLGRAAPGAQHLGGDHRRPGFGDWTNEPLIAVRCGCPDNLR